MSFVDVSRDGEIATVALHRGKVNALNDDLVGQLSERLKELEEDRTTQAVILTGTGKFFSFGFDIPGLYDHSPESFTGFLQNFTNLYTHMFLYPKPLIAALNGHTIAGGCMLATACDYRLMVSGRAKISLNEIAFAATVFAGNTEMLKFWVGQRNATTILYSGTMYTADEALELGLVDEVSSEESLPARAKEIAADFAKKNPAAFRNIKGLLRKPVTEEMTKREADSIREFVDIWYSDKTREYLREFEIRS